MPTYSNMTPIIIPDSGIANPYPSNILVSAPFSALSQITVTLHNLTHTFPADIRLLLVSPSGDNQMLMLNQGGNTDLTGIDITFDDNALLPIPMGNMANVSATYKPLPITLAYPNLWLTPAPVPQVYSTAVYTLSSQFTGPGKNPNGNWSLYVLDDAFFDQGVIADGWSISLSFVPCLHPDTKVEVPNGHKEIKNLRTGDIVIDSNGNHVELIGNICFDIPVKRFVKISKGSLSNIKVIPSSDLYITRDHPILHQGKSIPACSLINKDKNMRKRIRMAKVGNVGGIKTWSLLTKDKCFVMMQGVPVATWTEKNLPDMAQKYLFNKY